MGKVETAGVDECWEWAGARNRDGYGVVFDGEQMTLAHRVVYVVGPIPAGHCVCHACDNRGCVNPRHLWAGTQADNVHDCVAKGRRNQHPLPSRRGARKLPPAARAEVRARFKAGEPSAELAAEYGISTETVRRYSR